MFTLSPTEAGVVPAAVAVEDDVLHEAATRAAVAAALAHRSAMSQQPLKNRPDQRKLVYRCVRFR